MLQKRKSFKLKVFNSPAPTFTREGSQVRSLHRPPYNSLKNIYKRSPYQYRLNRFDTKQNKDKLCAHGENPGTLHEFVPGVFHVKRKKSPLTGEPGGG